MNKNFVFFVLILPFTIYAADKDVIKLDVDQSVEKAIENNLNLKNSSLDLKIKKISMLTSWNSVLPGVSLSAGLGKGNDFSGNDIDTDASLSLGLSSSVSLSATIATDILKSINQYQSGEITYSQAKVRLETDVTKYYYTIVLQKKKLELSSNKLDNTLKRLNVAEKKAENGSLSEIDRLKAELSYKNAMYDRKKTENELQKLLLNFNYTIGLESDDIIDFTTAFPDLEKINICLDDIDITKTDTIKLLYNQIKNNEISQASNVLSTLPSLSIGYSISSAYNNDPFKASSLSTNNEDWKTSGSLRFSVSVPLKWAVPFSEQQLAVINSGMNIKIANNKLEEGKKELELKILEFKLTIKNVKEDIDSLIINREIASKTYDMVKTLYDAGGKDYLELKDAENDFYQTKINILTASYEYISNVLELNYLLNGAL